MWYVRNTITRVTGALAVVLTIALSALMLVPQPASAAPYTASSQSATSTSQAAKSGQLKIQPGQTIVISHPLPQDPKATVRISLSAPSATTSSRVSARGVQAYTSTCINGIKETETAYNGYGSAIYWYAITIEFCYDGTSVWYQTSPPSESWWTCCLWGLNSHRASTSGVNTAYGVSHGCGFFGGPFWQSDTLWVTIDTYSDGSYYGGGGYGSC